MIVGDGYHPKLDDPNGLKPLRALFIKVDGDGNEEWILPFGTDTYMPSIGRAFVENTNGYYTGYGVQYTDSINPLIMNFDYMGNQIDYYLLEADTLFGGSFDYGFEYANQLDDGNYYLGISYNKEYLGDVNWGQIILDEEKNIVKSFKQENSYPTFSVYKTSDNKYIQASKTPEIDDPYESDIYMFK